MCAVLAQDAAAGRAASPWFLVHCSGFDVSAALCWGSRPDCGVHSGNPGSWCRLASHGVRVAHVQGHRCEAYLKPQYYSHWYLRAMQFLFLLGITAAAVSFAVSVTWCSSDLWTSIALSTISATMWSIKAPLYIPVWSPSYWCAIPRPAPHHHGALLACGALPCRPGVLSVVQAVCCGGLGVLCCPQCAKRAVLCSVFCAALSTLCCAQGAMLSVMCYIPM